MTLSSNSARLERISGRQASLIFSLASTAFLLHAASVRGAEIERGSNGPPVSSVSGVLTVASDGSARFKTVQSAIAAAATGTAANPTVIRIKRGAYKELIYLQREKRFLHLIGEEATNTVLTYDLNANLPGPDGKAIGTFRTSSTYIDADDFTAENITFENSAGPVGQALAIRIDGDHAVFRNCRFLGWQDTVLDNRGHHYFTNCYIAGHVDFIFGAATSFFDRCHIHCLRDGYITAASTPSDQPLGFVFSHCKITAENSEIRTYLGRPWRPYASVIYLNTEMSSVVRPAGWDNWRDPAREKTVRFSEFGSSGPGGDTSARVSWSQQLSREEAAGLTAEKVLGFR
jgi:pectinesterase